MKRDGGVIRPGNVFSDSSNESIVLASSTSSVFALYSLSRTEWTYCIYTQARKESNFFIFPSSVSCYLDIGSEGIKFVEDEVHVIVGELRSAGKSEAEEIHQPLVRQGLITHHEVPLCQHPTLQLRSYLFKEHLPCSTSAYDLQHKKKHLYETHIKFLQCFTVALFTGNGGIKKEWK